MIPDCYALRTLAILKTFVIRSFFCEKWLLTHVLAGSKVTTPHESKLSSELWTLGPWYHAHKRSRNLDCSCSGREMYEFNCPKAFVVRGGAATGLQPGYEKEKRLRLPDVLVSSDRYIITRDCEQKVFRMWGFCDNPVRFVCHLLGAGYSQRFTR